MSPKMIVAILLIALGVVGLGYQGITYTSRDRVVDAGPIKVDADRQHTIPIAPIVAGVALAGGIALLVVGRKSA
ncbi:MAG TPA: DUF3185 domain-containing protein [Phycisphaerae bacterium]